MRGRGIAGNRNHRTVRMWVRQAEIDAGSRLAVSSDESAELTRLKRENAELKRANVILRTASAFFADPHAVRAGGLGGHDRLGVSRAMVLTVSQDSPRSRANAPMVIRKHISRPKM
jgi:hypothetical protein